MIPNDRLVRLVVGGFLLAALVNVYWETQVVPDREPAERIAVLRDDGRLVTLTGTTRSTPRELYWAPAALLEVGGGGVLRVPATGLVDEFAVEHLARMAIELSDHPFTLSSAQVASIEEAVRFSGTGRIGGTESPIQEFHVAAATRTEPTESLSLYFFGDVVYFVDDSLLQGVQP